MVFDHWGYRRLFQVIYDNHLDMSRLETHIQNQKLTLLQKVLMARIYGYEANKLLDRKKLGEE